MLYRTIYYHTNNSAVVSYIGAILVLFIHYVIQQQFNKKEVNIEKKPKFQIV